MARLILIFLTLLLLAACKGDRPIQDERPDQPEPHGTAGPDAGPRHEKPGQDAGAK